MSFALHSFRFIYVDIAISILIQVSYCYCSSFLVVFAFASEVVASVIATMVRPLAKSRVASPQECDEQS